MKASQKILTVILVVIAYTTLIIRSLMSVELTDEAYGVAEIYNASFGKSPFVDIWDPHPGWFLYVPFLKIFQVFSPQLVGCMLYFRLIYFFLATIIVVAAYKLNKQICLLPFIAGVGYVSFSIPQMGHNAGVSFLLILAFCLLCEDRTLWYRFFSGIVMGFACILYPTIAVLTFFMIIPILILSEKKTKMTLSYCSGVALVGLSFFLWILVSSKSVDSLIIGIKATISTPHETNKGAIDISFLQKTFLDRWSVFYTTERSVIWIIYLISALITKIVIWKTNKGDVNPLLVEYLLFIALATVQIFIDSDVQPLSRGGYITYTIFTGLIYYIALNWKQTRKQAKLLILIAFGWILTYCFSSDNKNLFFGMDAAGALIFFTACYTVLTCSSDNNGYNIKKKSLKQVAFPTILMVIGIACYFGYVYRDAPVGEMNTKVNYGIYAGLYTTEDNAKYVEELERNVENVTKGHKTLFVVNNMPTIYLMSKVEPFTPQTWDAQFLARGYTSSYPVVSYFEFKEKKPEIIIANDYIYSSLFEREDIEIWSYINEYYVSCNDYEYADAGKMKVWKLK